MGTDDGTAAIVDLRAELRFPSEEAARAAATLIQGELTEIRPLVEEPGSRLIAESPRDPVSHVRGHTQVTVDRSGVVVQSLCTGVGFLDLVQFLAVVEMGPDFGVPGPR